MVIEAVGFGRRLSYSLPMIPRIANVRPEPPTTLHIEWGTGETVAIDLSDWIGTGGSILAPLREARVFATARVGAYGEAVEWEGRDLAIDGYHLARLGQG